MEEWCFEGEIDRGCGNRVFNYGMAISLEKQCGIDKGLTVDLKTYESLEEIRNSRSWKVTAQNDSNCISSSLLKENESCRSEVEKDDQSCRASGSSSLISAEKGDLIPVGRSIDRIHQAKDSKLNALTHRDSGPMTSTKDSDEEDDDVLIPALKLYTSKSISEKCKPTRSSFSTAAVVQVAARSESKPLGKFISFPDPLQSIDLPAVENLTPRKSRMVAHMDGATDKQSVDRLGQKEPFKQLDMRKGLAPFTEYSLSISPSRQSDDETVPMFLKIQELAKERKRKDLHGQAHPSDVISELARVFVEESHGEQQNNLGWLDVNALSQTSKAKDTNYLIDSWLDPPTVGKQSRAKGSMKTNHKIND